MLGRTVRLAGLRRMKAVALSFLIGATVIFLVWLWFSNLALMIGAHFNVEHSKVVRPRADAEGIKA